MFSNEIEFSMFIRYNYKMNQLKENEKGRGFTSLNILAAH